MSRRQPSTSSIKRRCGARKRRPIKRDKNGDPVTTPPYCRNWAVPGSARCRLHGGLSTGPKSPEGKDASIAARVEGRRQWVAFMKEQGLKLPCGRKNKDARPAIKFTGKMELDRKARVAVIRRRNNAEYKAALQAAVAAKEEQARRQAEQERALRAAQDAAINWQRRAREAQARQWAEVAEAKLIASGFYDPNDILRRRASSRLDSPEFISALPSNRRRR
jgi:hypothetical protein